MLTSAAAGGHAEPGWALAQINVARLAAPKGDPQVQPFFDALDAMNALADASPGFLWRLAGYGGDATDLNPTGDERVIVNMSAWSGREALFDYVYRSGHRPVMARRREWFEPHQGAYQALWWVPLGNWPSPAEGLARLDHLERLGPTPAAFTFKAHFPPPAAPGNLVDSLIFDGGST
jgi:hypothetical protein